MKDGISLKFFIFLDVALEVFWTSQLSKTFITTSHQEYLFLILINKSS